MTHPLSDLSVLDQFAGTPFPPGYPNTERTFFSPVDKVHDALIYVLESAQNSLDIAMYGLDDPQIVAAIIKQMANPNVRVRLTLDSSQAAGVHEKQLLEQKGLVNNDISIGTSEKGAIMHLKSAVIDSTVAVTGSTNWSDSGEEKQDNQLTVEINPIFCAQLSDRIDAIHQFQLNAEKG